MTWHYQATKETIRGEDIYTIREVYDKYGWTVKPIHAQGSTKEELIQDLRNMLSDVVAKPVLDVTKGETE